MIPKVEDAYHVHLPCSFFRTTPFEIDFSGVFLYFTVSSTLWHTSHLLSCCPNSKAPYASDVDCTLLPVAIPC